MKLCKDCDKRYAGCHAVCEDYAAWKAERSARTSKIIEARNRERSPRARWPESRSKLYPYKGYQNR